MPRKAWPRSTAAVPAVHTPANGSTITLAGGPKAFRQRSSVVGANPAGYRNQRSKGLLALTPFGPPVCRGGLTCTAVSVSLARLALATGYRGLLRRQNVRDPDYAVRDRDHRQTIHLPRDRLLSVSRMSGPADPDKLANLAG